jgi:tape measure domain-containing protein
MADLPVVGVQLVAAGLTGFENTLNQANKAASNFANNVNSSISNIGKGRSTSFVTQIENDFNRLNKLSSGGLRLNFVDQIASQLDAATGKMATGIKGTGGITSWMQTIQNNVNRMGGIKLPQTVLEGFGKGFGDLGKSAQQAATVVADSGQKASSATVQSADKIAIAQARVENAQAKAATASAVGANQIAASGSKATLAAANTAAGITIANNRVVSSYAQTAANVIGSISNIVQSVNRMLLSIANTVGTMLNNVISAVGRVGGILGGALGAAGGAMGGVAGGVGGALQNAIKFVTSFGQSSNTASGGVDKLASSIKNVGAAAEGTRNPLTFMQNALSVGLGNAAAMGTQYVVSKLKWMTEQFFQSTMDYQNAQVGLIGLLQRELTKGGMAVGEALAPATQQAKWLTKELSDLAILSPYMMKDVQQMFKESMAFGQSAMGAKQFTKDILNIAAGLGASNDMLQRMAYNFSQIGMEGSISALNLRQLAQAGFDLTDVIVSVGKATGVAMQSNEDFNAAITSGLITWDDFDKALTYISETRFPGAADRMARTLFGLQNNIKDFFNLTVPLLTLPAADELAARANVIFNKFVEFRGSGTLEALGIMFGEWFASALDSLGELKDRVGSVFGDIIGAAYDWGGNLIINFAAGIIGGAQWALGNAMDVVSNAISYWLAPGSPPNVAPDLAVWGADALDEWLGGFKEADWDLFDAITKPLKSILDVLGSDLFIGIGTRLAQALSEIALTGSTAIDFVKEISDATGEFGDEMAKLIELQLQYASSAKLVEDADKRITAGESKQAALVREYNKMRKAGVSPALLRAKGLEIEATKDEIYLAKKQKLDEEAKLELLKKQLDLQERLINALIDFAKQQEKMNKAAEHERNAAEKAAKDNFPNTLPRVVKPSVWPDMTGPNMDDIKKNIMANWYAMLTPLTPLREAWDLFITTMSDRLTYFRDIDLKALWKNMKNGLGMLLPGLTSIQQWWKINSTSITSGMKGIGDGLFRIATIILQILGGAWKAVWPYIVQGFDILVMWFTTRSPQINGILQIWVDKLTAIGNYMEKTLGPIFIVIAELIAAKLLGNINLLLLALDGLLLLLAGDWKGAWELWSKAGTDAAQGIRDSINGAWKSFSDWWNGAPGQTPGKDQLAATWTSITDSLGGALSGAWAWFTKWWNDNATGAKLVALWTSVTTSLGNALSGAWAAFSNWWTTAPPGGKTGQQTLIEIAEGIGTGIYDALVGAWKNLKTWYDANQAEMWAGIWNVAIDLLTKLIVPALTDALLIAWDGFVALAKSITVEVKLALFEPIKDPTMIPIKDFVSPKVPGGFELPQWYLDWMSQFSTDTMKRMFAAPLAEWSGAWDAMNLKSETTSGEVSTDYTGMWTGVGATNEIMMPVQQTAWSTFWNGLGFSFSTWSTGISSTWDTMWANIENFFVTRRVALYFAWQDWTSSITLMWNTWTGSLSSSWDTFWNTLRDNLIKWKDENIEPLANAGRNIMNAIIGGLAAAASDMTGIGAALVNAIFGQAMYKIREWLYDHGLGPDPGPGAAQGAIIGAAAGGVIQKASLLRVGELNKKEAIIPLESSRSIQLLARALNQAMHVSMNPIVMPISGMSGPMGGGVVYNQNLYVNTVQPAVNVLQSYESMRAYYGTY